MADRANQVAHRAALVLFAQADNPIPLGETGLWFDGSDITFVAANGDQTLLGDSFAYGTTGQMVPVSGTSDEGVVDAVARIDHDHELADGVITAAKLAPNTVLQLLEQQIVFGDLTDAVSGEAQAVNIGSALPAGAIVLAHEVKLDTLFAGGSISMVKLDIGGTEAKSLVGQFNVHDTSAGAPGTGVWSPGYEHLTTHATHAQGTYGGQQLVATFTPTADSLSHLTAGDLTIRVWYIVP